MYIDINSGVNGEGLILFTAAHELVHMMREGSPEDFNDLASFLIKNYNKQGVDVNKLVLREMTLHTNLNYDQAYEEVIAKSCESFLKDIHLTDKAQELYKQNKSLANKLKGILHRILKAVKKWYSNLKPQTAEGKYVAQMKDVLSEAYDKYITGINNASQNLRNMEKTDDSIKRQSRETLNTIDKNFRKEVEQIVADIEKSEYNKSNIKNSSVSRKGEKYEPTDEFRRIQESCRRLPAEYIELYHRERGKCDERLRKNLALILSRELSSWNSCNGNDVQLLRNNEKGTEFRIVNEIDNKLFHDIFEIVQKFLWNGDAVDVHEAEDYKNCKNYLSDDGFSGFSITEDGDLISVFSLNRGFLATTGDYMVKQGAITLDCFNSKGQHLPEYYSKYLGFQSASILAFNEQILRESKGDSYTDFFIQNYGRAPVYFMVHSDNEIEVQKFGKYDYDKAVEYRDKFTEQNSENNAKNSSRDSDYLSAIENGDMQTAQSMVDEAAKEKGYSNNSSYQGTSAFNGAAPSSNGYYTTLEERLEAWEDGSYEDTWTLGDELYRGMEMGDLDRRIGDRELRNANRFGKESIENIRKVLKSKSQSITMYRSVPSNITESKFRNGDWITPSREYAIDNAEIHGWGDNYRIIEQEVSVDDVWWDGNDINEWGYDNGSENEVYKNTANNVKTLDVTYDDNGNVIPLSERFNESKEDIRYSSRDYSYEALVSKPDMKVTIINENVNWKDRKSLINGAIANAKRTGYVNKNDNAVIEVVDIGKGIIVSKKSLQHSLDRRAETNAPVIENIGSILANSIRINELNPRTDNINNTYVLIGAAKSTTNGLYIVSSVVNSYTNEVESIDVLYSVNAKNGIKKEAAGHSAPRVSTPSTASTISISNLLDYVNKYFPDILPESVLKHYGYTERPEGKLGKSALYSSREDFAFGFDSDLFFDDDGSIEDNFAKEYSTHHEDIG